MPTFDALELLGQELPPGRGSPVHRYVQHLVAEAGQNKGYMTEVEKELPDGSAVDVHLERGGYRVAVEVAVMSRPQRELEHVARCLEAGYDRVCCVFADEGLLERTREGLEQDFSDEERERVQLIALSRLAEAVV